MAEARTTGTTKWHMSFSLPLKLFAPILLFAGSIGAAAQTADDAVGIWLSDNGTHLQAYKCGTDLCVKIIKAVDGKTGKPAPQLKDTKNKDKSQRERLLQGTDIMTGAKKKGDKSWKGKIYNPADGGIYSGTLTVQSKDAVRLKGCWIWPACTTKTWTRLKADGKN